MKGAWEPKAVPGREKESGFRALWSRLDKAPVGISGARKRAHKSRPRAMRGSKQRQAMLKQPSLMAFWFSFGYGTPTGPVCPDEAWLAKTGHVELRTGCTDPVMPYE